MFENEGQPQTETITETTQTDTSGAGAGADGGQAAPSIVDLDSVEKFKFEGKEWTPKDFRGAHMMHADYSRKTQEISQERKYYDNLNHDLEAVKANPQLISQFKQIYPEKFHKFLSYVQQTGQVPSGQQMQQQNAGQKSQIDPAFEQRINKIESHFQQQESRSAEAEVDSHCTKMATKFPDVPEEFGLSAVEYILKQKRADNPDYELTAADWEKAWKSVDDKLSTSFKSRQTRLVKGQQSANQKSKDVASGGGTPGQAPKLPRTLKEATEIALQDPRFQ